MKENKDYPVFTGVNEDTWQMYKGLTKREYFAAKAMQGILSDQTYLRPNETMEIAERAVNLADALLKQLEP